MSNYDIEILGGLIIGIGLFLIVAWAIAGILGGGVGACIIAAFLAPKVLK